MTLLNDEQLDILHHLIETVKEARFNGLLDIIEENLSTSYTLEDLNETLHCVKEQHEQAEEAEYQIQRVTFLLKDRIEEDIANVLKKRLTPDGIGNEFPERKKFLTWLAAQVVDGLTVFRVYSDLEAIVRANGGLDDVYKELNDFNDAPKHPLKDELL